jgi:acyl-CoA hydrolase
MNGSVGLRVADQPGSDGLSDQRAQVRSNSVHFIDQVLTEVASVVRQLYHSLSEALDVEQIQLVDIGSHGTLGSVHVVFGLGLVVVEDLLNLGDR